MHTVGKDIGGTVRKRANRRPDASPTVEILTTEGGSLIAAGTAATPSSVNTTTTQAVTAGKPDTFTLTSAASVVVGDEYLLGPNASGQREFVKCAGINGLIFTPQFPPLYTYASGVAFVGTYISYDLAAANAGTAGSYQARFSWKLATVDQEVLVLRFDIVDYGVSHVPCTMNDIRVLDPKVTTRLASDFDYDRGLAAALNEVLRELNESNSALGLLTDDDWRELVALKFMTLAARQWGQSYKDTREMWEEQYQQRYVRWKSQFFVDKDQDGTVQSHEGNSYGIRIGRTS